MGRVRSLFGTETEYSLHEEHPASTLPIGFLATKMLERAAARPHLPAEGSGLFATTGGRVYLDAGAHPEYAAPESTNPWDAVRATLLGDALMAEFVREVAAAHEPPLALSLRSTNVDYASATTSGNHENYLHACEPARLREALVPHVVTRVVYTGGGGLDPFAREHPRFVLSPRALFMRRGVALSAPQELALVDCRDEALCSAFSRQHLICGDANRSQLSLFLRLGATALVIALIEAGLDEGAEVRLDEPLNALQVVARDPTLRRRLRTSEGRRLRALDIQRHYLGCATRHLDVLPTWAPAVCDVWQDTLDRLEEGPSAVADRLDWAIKFQIFRERAARRGRCWSPRSTRAGASCGTRAGGRARSWRAELCEIDLLYGRLEPPGLFDALDRAGVLRHQVGGVGTVTRLTCDTPSEGRARIRGRVVAELWFAGTRATCGWDRVTEPDGRGVLDLTDPFADREMWRSPVREGPNVLLGRLLLESRDGPAGERASSLRELCQPLCEPGTASLSGWTGQDAITLNNRACTLRAAGRTAEAEWLMRAALAVDLDVRPPHHPKIPHRRNNLATVLLMQGRLSEAREQLELAWRHYNGRLDLTSARILVMRVALALMEGEPIAPLVTQLKTLLATWPLPDFAHVDDRWNVDAVLGSLPLDAESRGLLTALATVLNEGRPAMAALDAYAAWSGVPGLA